MNTQASTPPDPTPVGAPPEASSAPIGAAADPGASEPTLAEIAARSRGVGLSYGLAAYLWWGLVPIYFKAVATLHLRDDALANAVSPYELLSHRIIWGVPLLIALIALKRRWREVWAALTSPVVLPTLALSATLVALNWLMYIWAVTNDRIVEASLGYFINPLVNVAFGVLFFKDRMTRAQVGGLILAGAGVLFLTIAEGRPPWISLGLAFSFALYALIRKRTSAKPIPGLLVETLLLLPLAAGYLFWLHARGGSSFAAGSWRADIFLIAAGAVTIIPLVWFVEAAKRLTLSTMGFLQYLSPSMQFVLGVLVFGEAFSMNRAIAFACIWTALAIYSTSLVRESRRRRRERAEAA